MPGWVLQYHRFVYYQAYSIEYIQFPEPKYQVSNSLIKYLLPRCCCCCACPWTDISTFSLKAILSWWKILLQLTARLSLARFHKLHSLPPYTVVVDHSLAMYIILYYIVVIFQSIADAHFPALLGYFGWAVWLYGLYSIPYTRTYMNGSKGQT